MNMGEKAGIDSKDASAKLEMNYQALLENTGISIVIVDIAGKYLFANSTATSPLGCDVQEVIGKTMSDFLPPEIAKKYLERNQRLIKTGGGQNYEATFDLPSGTKTFLINDQVLKDAQGNGFAIQSSSIDITERKETEQILAEKEEQYRLLIQNLPGTTVFLFDHDLRFILAEGQVHSKLGFTTESLLGKTLWEVLPQEDAKQLSAIYYSTLEGKATENYSSEYQGKSYRVNFAPVRNNQGKIIAGLVVSQDITERKKAEDALRESEKKWHLLVETIPDYIALYDAEGRYLFLNHFAEGFSAKDIEGKGYTDFLAEESKELYEETFRKAKETKQTQYIEYSAFGDHYSIRSYESFFVPIFENNVLVNMLVIARDVTERKRADEELLKSKHLYDDLVSKIKVGVYVLRSKPDGTFGLEYASPRMAELLGLSVDELLSNHEAIFKSIHPEDLDSFTRLNLIGIQNNVPFDWKGRIVVKGEVSWLHITSLPQLLGNGDTFWHGLIEDITERLAIEAEMKLKNEELTNLNATKDKFFSIIAHDLKSPFNSILGLSEFMVSQIQEGNYEKIEEYADTIRNSSQRAMDLLQNLLEWSRVQTGRMVFSPENLKIDLLVHEALNLLNETATQKGIVISRNIPANLEARVDQSMFSTIIRNLVSNAIKFSYTGGEIEVELREVNNQVEVSVSDNGIGIQADQIENLFHIDKNQSKPGTQNEKGTGLGLILCKEFVEKHGGKLWVESEYGKGSKFRFTIPKI